MWRLLILLGLMVCLAPCQAAGKRLFPLDPPEVTKINERVYALIGPLELPTRFNRGYMVNSTAIIGEKGVILVDTGYSDEIGQHLKKAVARITDKPVTHIINTHHHGDHVLGNVAFKGAEIISSEKCKKLVEETGNESLAFLEAATQRKFPKTRPVPATRTFSSERTEIVIQGVRLVLWVPKGSHTLGDMMVYLPDERVLISGDILVYNITPNFEDGMIQNWVETLAQVVALNPEVIVPGHGLLMKSADAAVMQQRMAALYAGVEAGYKKGLTDNEIRKTLDLEEWGKLHFFPDLMGKNINRTYLEVEEKNFFTSP